MLFKTEFKYSEIEGNLDFLEQSISENRCNIRECTNTVRCSSSGLSQPTRCRRTEVSGQYATFDELKKIGRCQTIQAAVSKDTKLEMDS
jgi:hypothetical protein